jgi:Na+/proline symporter
MLTGPAVIGAAIGYVGLLFFIAWWGDNGGRKYLVGGRRTLVYALSLAVYCTSWTYYGSVGLASARGLDFLPIYIGPILVVGFGNRLIQRIANLAHAQNLTTVADFVSARYGKSQIVAALAALIALMASAPYIALQLKAITQTILMVLASFQQGRLTQGAPSQTLSLAVTILLAAFAMAFGTRRLNPKENQQGLILAIAVESVVKLVAFLGVGAFVVWGIFGGLDELGRLAESPRIAAMLSKPPNAANWFVTTLLSASAILLLPRQFHVTIVENSNPNEIRAAAWLFPAYLVLINLFVLPLAIAGLTMFPDGAIDRDLTVLALPLSTGARGLALTTMIGGLSAATAMVVVDSIALAITVSNDLVMPILLRRREVQTQAAEGEIGARVLMVRRLAVLAVLAFGYLYARLANDAGLAAIGLLSFAALAQIAPAFLGAERRRA